MLIHPFDLLIEIKEYKTQVLNECLTEYITYLPLIEVETSLK